MGESKIELDRIFWENKYQTNEIGWDIGHISTPIKDYIDQLTNKKLKILIPGCGNAYEAEYLLNKNFKNVFLIDFSKTALNNFIKRVPLFQKENLICKDFFQHNETYDLIIEQTFFCAINPIFRKKYAAHSSNLLKLNGKLVGLLFNDQLNTDKPPYGGNKEEYINYFTPFYQIEIMEKTYNSIAPREDRELFIKLLKK